MIEIKDINDEKLNIFLNMSENELAHIYEPGQGLFLAESQKILERALAAGYEPEIALIEKRVINQIEPLLKPFDEVTIYVAEYDVIKNITGYPMTGGVLCAMKRKELPSFEEIVKEKKNITILDGVVNPTNIGAIFRNAAALGIEAVILSPDCCNPLYKRAIRVSMGTVFQIPWTKLKNDWPDVTLDYLKSEGYTVIATALDEKAMAIDDIRVREVEKKAILMGSEGYGLKEDTLKKSDMTVYIPMYHGVDSLNVAAASALAFWELCK